MWKVSFLYKDISCLTPYNFFPFFLDRAFDFVAEFFDNIRQGQDPPAAASEYRKMYNLFHPWV